LNVKVVFISLTLVSLGFASLVGATPRRLPFTYPNETLAEAAVEIEGYSDVNLLRSAADPNDPNAGNIWTPQYIFQIELEYGLSDRWELGFYQIFRAEPQPGGDNLMGFDGLKWRIRTRLAEPGQLPIDIGFYLELETMHDELSLEEKVNLQRRLGRLTWMANLWVEETLARPLDTTAHGRTGHFIVNPTTGIVIQTTPGFHPGIEFWARGQVSPSGVSAQDRENSRVHYFVGPTAHVNFGRLWWSAGLYVHANSVKPPQPGDAYGPVWFRSVLGMEL
jgi:hypothetical protein